jgi:DnaK suppressor protein
MSEDFSPEQLRELDNALRALEEQLLEALDDSQAGAGTVELDQTRVGRVSRGDALQQQAMAQAGQRALQQRLAATRAALRRMDKGDYGYCLECEEPIAFGRLQRQPEVAYCLRCQAAREG